MSKPFFGTEKNPVAIPQKRDFTLGSSKYCPISKDLNHLYKIEGKPLSGFTWLECELCGFKKFRG